MIKSIKFEVEVREDGLRRLLLINGQIEAACEIDENMFWWRLDPHTLKRLGLCDYEGHLEPESIPRYFLGNYAAYEIMLQIPKENFKKDKDEEDK